MRILKVRSQLPIDLAWSRGLWLHWDFAALFMRTLNFTIAFFAAVNHLILTDLLRNKTLLHGFKRSWFVICGFRSVLCFSVSRFVACDRNYDWRQRKTQLWSLEFACSHEKRSKVSVQSEAPGSSEINGQLAVYFRILLVFIQYNISV